MKKTVIVVLAACLCWQAEASFGEELALTLLRELAIKAAGGAVAATVEEVRKDEKTKEAERKERERQREEMIHLTSDFWTPLRFGLGSSGPNLGFSLPWKHTNVYGLDVEALAVACDLVGAEVGAFGALAHTVYGVQVSTLDTGCNAFCGLQVGGLMVEAREDSWGLQAGILSKAGWLAGIQVSCMSTLKTCYGAQVSIVSSGNVKGGSGVQFAGLIERIAQEYAGLQAAGLAIKSDHIDGVQMAGLYTTADCCNGLQLGLINHAKSGHCVQIGLVNITEDRILPFFNWSWK